jgi:hypothetical protein
VARCLVTGQYVAIKALQFNRFSAAYLNTTTYGALAATKIPASGRNRDLKETYTFETIILVCSW